MVPANNAWLDDKNHFVPLSLLSHHTHILKSECVHYTNCEITFHLLGDICFSANLYADSHGLGINLESCIVLI